MVVPSGLEASGLDAESFGGVVSEKVEGEVAQDAKVLGGATSPDTAMILVEADIMWIVAFASARVVGVSQRLAVDSDHLRRQHLGHRMHPVEKTAPELLRIEDLKDPIERVVR